MNPICFSGPAGSGKTTTLNELVNIPELRGRVMLLPSVTRSFYASRGVSGEASFMENLSPQEKLTFQIDLLQHYVDTFLEACEDATSEGKTLISDRSIYDHIAYALMFNMDVIDRYDVSTFLGQAKKLRSKTKFRVVSFPMPTWCVADDGFRRQVYGKDLAHSHILSSLLLELPEWHVFRLQSEIPRERAEDVLRRFLSRTDAQSAGVSGPICLSP